MKKIERKVLFKEKIAEGKSEDIANFEIIRTDNFIKQTSKNKRKNIKELSKDKNKRFKQEYKRLLSPKRYRTLEFSKLYINRVIRFLKTGNYNQSEISDNCCISDKRLWGILEYLKEQGIIESEFKPRGEVYHLK